MDEKSKYVVIGAGGIGGPLLRSLSRYLQTARIRVIDGDRTEKHNLVRQEGEVAVFKPTFWSRLLKNVDPVDSYLTPDNIADLIPEKDPTFVFVCVDNHKTRKLVQDHVESMKNVVMISGGNDLTTGDVRIFIRKKMKSLTPRIDYLQPDIANPADRRPDEISCGELVESSPQIIFTNTAVASAMLNAYYAVVKDKLDYNVVYIDIEANKQSVLNTGLKKEK